MTFLDRNRARIFAVVSVLLPLAGAYVHNLPVAAVLAALAALLGLNVDAQTVPLTEHDSKVLEALYTDVPTGE